MKKTLSLLLSLAMLLGIAIMPAAATDILATNENPDTTIIDRSEDNIESNENVQVTATWGSDYDTATEFTISSKEDLLAFAEMVNSGKDFKDKTINLVNTLDLTETAWTPIGCTDNEGSGITGDNIFAGTFNGNGNSIQNITLQYGTTDEEPLYDAGGFFGVLSGKVMNLHIENISLTAAYDNVGGIAGILESGAEIEDCTVSGLISGAAYNGENFGSRLGGIAGSAAGAATIQDCKNYAKVITACEASTVAGILGYAGHTSIVIEACINHGEISGVETIGGIVASGDKATVTGCTNSGVIVGKHRVGGIVGDTLGTTIEKCNNTASFGSTDSKEIGGIVGRIYDGTKVEDCTNTGAITGSERVGGIAGSAIPYDAKSAGHGYIVTKCNNEGEVSGWSDVGGIIGGADAYLGEVESEVKISGCNNSAPVTGGTNVGGIIGSNNAVSPTIKKAITSATEVSGCINTGSVPEGAGAIVGNNNDQGAGGAEAKAGIVQNNFWPAELGENAVGSGAGSSGSESSEAVKNNSSYLPDGTLTTPVDDTDGEGTIDNLGEAIDKVIGGGEGGSGVPEVLKVTVTYNNGGHGTAPASETVTKGSKVTLPSMSNDGYYTFIGWSNGGVTYTNGQEVPVMEDMTFTAQWRDDTPSNGGGDSSDPTYNVALPGKVTGGSVKVSPRNAEKGETVTITVTPDDGYELDQLIVTDRKGNELDLTDKGNGKFTFKMPASRVEIEVSFQEIVIEPVNPFVDVSTSDYYYDAVLWAAENGVTNGTSATTFGPDMAVSRAQMVTFLWRAHGSPKVAGTNPFTDVSASDYYYDAVLWAVANGVTNGTSATTFSPDTAVTRSQAVTFQWRAAGSPVVSGSSFGDVAADAYYVNAVTWAVANGITNGTGGNTFSPDVVVSRAQAVTFLYRENSGK